MDHRLVRSIALPGHRRRRADQQLNRNTFHRRPKLIANWITLGPDHTLHYLIGPVRAFLYQAFCASSHDRVPVCSLCHFRGTFHALRHVRALYCRHDRSNVTSIKDDTDGSDVELEVAKTESQFDQPIIFNQRHGEILDQVEIQEMNLVPIKAMNAAMELIRMKFSNTGGLLNCQWLAVAAVSPSELPSVDTILHNNRDHWVVTAKGFASTRSDTVLMFGWSENLSDQHFAYSSSKNN
ncbi:hypothetical protein DAPPUDRAFT_256695 [Daphnia pulex]|uniref:Uncharacterized protein n=1 Tax=Daphnia pulex TaxID=6669 RepID=E9HBX0_DAPPU|nr:hypothetical protein DAPPUDRAFT_256695 [Daphnia pulex]|eukprot:EFX70798.1 hypothetical protein DAPPUDRAFT_256695 [Daphnia pulex]